MTKDKKSMKSKKSTTKKRVYRISPLIPVIAVIEVLVLIAVTTYSWFYVQASKEIGSGTISVAADSGLDIDFQYSNVDDYINIWNYVGDDFTFEPATSLDGRTIYFPTSGTFNNDATGDIVFRDGTVNDINSKYLSIDFELTNTSEYDQYVYLNNKSYFHVQNKNSSAYEESRALRLAFYQNDGNSGNVGSSLLQSGSATDGGVIETVPTADSFTIYFENVNSSWGTNPNIYAYFYDSDDGSSPDYQTAWPGVKMDRVAGQTYSVTIVNPSTGGSKLKYDKLIISNNGSNDQRVTVSSKLTTSDNGKKYLSNGSSSAYTEHTIYFVKPYGWTNVYCHTWHSTGSSSVSYTNWPGDEMTYVGSGIYSYSFDGSQTGGFLFDNGNKGGTNQTVDLSVGGGVNGNLYYCTGTLSSGKYTATSTPYSSLKYRTIYFFNTYSWSTPYAMVSYQSGTSVTTCDIALTSLSGNVYYCTVPDTVYTMVYFHAKEQANDLYRTKQAPIVDQQVYRPNDDTSYDNGHYYRDMKTFMYDKYIKKQGYPVISPGVSAGFQRPYSPVITIDAYSGAATEVVPAYSYSIDNYILGSGTPLFVLKSNHMASLSMIMWLEGTDEACTTEGYAGKQIDLRLEFSTLYYSQDPNTQEYTVENIVNPGDSASYTYNFYDKTREIWTSDRQATESGVTVAPVMQLYDNTTKRGYLMHATEYASYDGRRKVSCWSVDAPQSIVNFGHDIIFRRVNPYNEDEVWNYWHAGRVAGGASDPVYQDLKEQQEAQASNYTAYDIAFSGGNTISFTAFSDGSPTNENLIVAKYNQDNGTQVERLSSDTIATLSSTYSTYLSNAAVPTLSCGGLWGNHAVRTLTLLDATNAHFIHNDHGVMTMNYSYPYSVSGTTQRTATIEYKASDDYGMLYYFIVPESLYTEKSGTAVVSDVKFKRYYNFNYTGVTYAINSERNNRILFDNKWNAGTPKGLYYEIGQKYNSSHNLEYLSYWGSDILYIQTNNTTNPHLTTGSNNMIQVEFYNTSNSSNKYYVVCFAEQTFKGTDGNSWGYTAIVPCNAAYDRYQVQYCYTNGGDKVYRSSSDITVYTSNVSSNTNTIDYRNTLYNSSAQKSEHICVIEYFENITIYFDSNQQAWTTSDKHQMYFYGKYEMEWPGADMYWVTDWSGYKRFGVSVNPNDYNKFIANNGYSWQTDEVSFSPMDNYQIFRNNNGKGVFRDVRVVPSGVDYTKVMHLSTAAAIDWPHYSDSASS